MPSHRPGPAGPLSPLATAIEIMDYLLTGFLASACTVQGENATSCPEMRRAYGQVVARFLVIGYWRFLHFFLTLRRGFSFLSSVDFRKAQEGWFLPNVVLMLRFRPIPGARGRK
jgi:hypothetical protein